VKVGQIYKVLKWEENLPYVQIEDCIDVGGLLLVTAEWEPSDATA
jgi:hypothetical protein